MGLVNHAGFRQLSRQQAHFRIPWNTTAGAVASSLLTLLLLVMLGLQHVHLASHQAAVVPSSRVHVKLQARQDLNTRRHATPAVVQSTTTALPWRAMAGVQKIPGRKPWQSPALVLSAFWDWRAPKSGTAPFVRLVMASDKHWDSSGVQCAFQYSGSDKVYRTAMSKLPSQQQSGDGMFPYLGGFGGCKTDGLTEPTQQRQLLVTLVSSNAQPPADLEHWVPVEVVPELSQVQLQQHAAGSGPMAVCTPPLHTDAYAASLVEWAEFQQLVGVEQVFVYDFNSGPLLRPLLQYYARTGFMQVFEWIIPQAIMANPSQECLLPFFYPSENRTRFGSAECTTHQDNYNIAWWGQSLAILDCLTRTAGRYRWVAVMDFDEYLIPRAAATIPQLLKGVGLAVQYTLPGRVLCSGCRHQFHLVRGGNGTAEHTLQPLRVVQGPDSGMGASCLEPVADFQHILWSSVVSDADDHKKSVVDPLAVSFPGIHTHGMQAFNGISQQVEVQPSQGYKLHDRAHDIHMPSTFATVMLPRLWQFVHDLHAAPYSHSRPLVPLLPAGCGAHAACAAGASKAVDFTLCNMYGHKLSKRIDAALQEMHKHSVFEPWLQLNWSAANVYGGHSFSKWAPPA